jgi:phosphoribosyl 1,2-cyclic phosphodiesterase
VRVASLGSGSKGNATLIQAGDTQLLLDCGFGLRETEQRLQRLGTSARELTAIVVTHEHGDHIGGVPPLARRYQLPVYLSFGTRQAVSGGRQSLEALDCREVRPERAFRVGALDVLPVPVPHDAREPLQFLFSAHGRCAGVLTDLGSLTPHVVEAYAECDSLVLECNHDPGMLAKGPYPPSLKRRVGGHLGHLSNGQAAALLEQINLDRLQHLVLSHLSEQNNTPQRALQAVHDVVDSGRERVRVACQQQGFDWLDIH